MSSLYEVHSAILSNCPVIAANNTHQTNCFPFKISARESLRSPLGGKL